MTILPGVSLMPSSDFRGAAAPLFDAGLVGVVEWTLDAGWTHAGIPDWLDPILDFFGQQGRLLGHGFGYSPLSGETHPRQRRWLDQLSEELQARRYRQVSEHLCFALGGDFSHVGPLPVPMTSRTLDLGRRRLEAMQERCGALPIGLENLATSLTERDALEQGAFLDALLAPFDGFVVLDLHNLYCQAHNFDRDPVELLQSYPLARVREVHLAGGSWDLTAAAPDTPMRRDTHDDPVPDEVFALLEAALSRCPRLEAAILERLAGTMDEKADQQGFIDDYQRMVRILRTHENAPEATS